MVDEIESGVDAYERAKAASDGWMFVGIVVGWFVGIFVSGLLGIFIFIAGLVAASIHFNVIKVIWHIRNRNNPNA
jgi:hypothetical protein